MTSSQHFLTQLLSRFYYKQLSSYILCRKPSTAKSYMCWELFCSTSWYQFKIGLKLTNICPRVFWFSMHNFIHSTELSFSECFPLCNLLVLFWHNRFYLIRILPFNSLQSTHDSIVIVVGASLLPEPSRILLVLLTKILIQI